MREVMKPKDKLAGPPFVTPEPEKHSELSGSLHSDHVEMQNYIKNRPILACKANPSVGKLVRAKLKRPNKNQNNTHNSDNYNYSSSYNSINISTHNMDIDIMANFQHNIDIGLKVTTRRCKDHGCHLHGALKCTNQARSNVSGRTYITRGLADCNTKCKVYLIQCKKCWLQYMGQMGQIPTED